MKGCIANALFKNTAFTSFCATRDYNYRPYINKADYDINFVLWI